MSERRFRKEYKKIGDWLELVCSLKFGVTIGTEHQHSGRSEEMEEDIRFFLGRNFNEDILREIEKRGFTEVK